MDRTQTTPLRPARRRPASRRGFSLLELMLVLIIIGLLSAVAAVAVVAQAKRARVSATKASMATIQTAIRNYEMSKGAPPAQLQLLWTGKFLEEGKGEVDAWREPFQYRLNDATSARQYELLSAGPDMEFGTEDDINVWTMQDEEDDA